MHSCCLLSLTPHGQQDTPRTRPSREDPAPQSERNLMLDSQSCGPANRSHAVTSPIAAWDSGGWGTVYRRWSPALARTGQRDRHRFSQGGHQIGSALALYRYAASNYYYMRDSALCLSWRRISRATQSSEGLHSPAFLTSPVESLKMPVFLTPSFIVQQYPLELPGLCYNEKH